MNEVSLLIGGRSVPASSGRWFERIDPVKKSPATRAAAAGASDIDAAVHTAAEAAPAWATTGPGKRRELLLHAAEVLLARTADFVRCMIAETGATEGWAGFNVAIGAAMLREAASMTTQIAGEVIPTGVREHGGFQSFGNVPRGSSADRHSASRSGDPGWRNQRADERSGRRGRSRGRADRSSAGAAHQLHGLDQGGSHRGGTRGQESEARSAGIGRQGAIDRA